MGLESKAFDKSFRMLSRKVFFLFFRDVLYMFHGQYITSENIHHFATLVRLVTWSETLQDMKVEVWQNIV